MAGGLTWALPLHAFRTTANLAEFDGVAARWETDTVSFRFHLDGAPNLPLTEVLEAAVGGWNVWEEPACNRLDIVNAGVGSGDAEPEDGVNTIQWIHDWSERGFERTAPGVTDVQYLRMGDGDWKIVEADIYLNAEHFTWRLDAGDDGVRVATVVAHEMGHAIGLLHPCEPSGSDGAPDCSEHPEHEEHLMYPGYNEGPGELSEDDEAGACFLYPADSCEDAGCPTGICTEKGCVEPCDPACESGERCRAGVCTSDDPPECPDGADCVPDGQNGRWGVFGDECVSGADCASGVCAETCSMPCVEDADCRAVAGVRCTDSLCRSTLGLIGDACTEAKECLGGECLGIDDAEPVCTRQCDTSGQCPADWSCDTLEGRSVCAPPGPRSLSGGCSTAHRARLRFHNRADATCLLVVLLTMARRRFGLRSREIPSPRFNEDSNGPFGRF